jgi:hypothetical protein
MIPVLLVLRALENWTLLTSHARVLLAITRDPGMRLRDIAATVGITERSVYAIVADLARAGYVAKHKDGRRNRYQIQAHLPLPGPASQQPAIGELLDLLTSQREAAEPS